MENKDNKSNEMSEEVITNDATKDGANASVVKADSTNAIAQANKDVITRNLAVLGEYRTFAESLILILVRDLKKMLLKMELPLKLLTLITWLLVY